MNSDGAGTPPPTEHGQISAEVIAMLEELLRMSSVAREIFGFVPLISNQWDTSCYGNGDIPQLPTVRVSAADVSSALQCPICLEEFVSGEEVSQTECGHSFHRDCMNPWLRLRRTCPKCRAPIGQTVGHNH